ncbi:hypothetical protein BBK82_03505 [Lentzea guizhouensis]|uniref:Uncharacterized protein n=1 Tax=Lentzea guizhouensis TaxID=1586287 RepID=A0A1B2HC45_9PSEU|nr:hypothetical protein [Lentzea guizhouensis]ANZ35282.1 hypothetical protein BBK82_03505 [Lentzea guizhouensis]
MLRHRLSTDERVNAALDVIESDLKTALATTAAQLNDLLLTKPDDTEHVHMQLQRVHAAMEQIDSNHRRYLTRA